MKLTSLTLEPMIFILLLTFIHQSKEDKSSLVDITDCQFMQKGIFEF